MEKDIMLKEDVYDSLVNFVGDKPEYSSMIEIVKNNMPTISRDTTILGGKTQSQFMDNFLTVSHPTDIRNMRQILAEIEKTRKALLEAYFNTNKTVLEIKRLERDILTETDEIEVALKQNEVNRKSIGLQEGKLYIGGAIRKLTNYVSQYNTFLKKLDKEELTEEDFEKDEEKYHIMKCFEQALSAARSHGGIIDEGNHIYLSQIGVNGAVAQQEISKYLASEGKIMYEGTEPSYNMQRQFLEDMYNKFKDCSKYISEKRGAENYTQQALIK